MAKRRTRDDGGLYWDKARQRWVAEVTMGFNPDGTRIIRKERAKTKTDAKELLKELINERDSETVATSGDYTVSDAVRDYIKNGLRKQSQSTKDNYQHLADVHIHPKLGANKYRDRKFTADVVDVWFDEKAEALSTRTLRLLHSLLSRATKHAQARVGVRRNLFALCEVPTGQEGRPSKSLTLTQAEAVLTAAEKDDSTVGEYTVVSLLAGVRTEEARPLTWPNVDLVGKPDKTPPVRPHIQVWRSVRAGGDTKTKKSRRSLALAQRAVDALARQRDRQAIQRDHAGNRWQDNGLVFASEVGTQLDSHNVRRRFRKIIKAAGLVPDEWTPRELRHSFVSLLSDSGVPIEDISRLCGHSNTTVTEEIYRHQLKPVIEEGAVAMDSIFSDPDR